MCLEVVLSVAHVGAIVDFAVPALNVAMLLVLVADIICLSFERPGIFATCPGAGKWSNVLCN